ELYIRPAISGPNKVVWKTICARCATTFYGLNFGFCLIASRDWEGPHESHILGSWHAVLKEKRSVIDVLVKDAWNSAELGITRKWKAAHGTLKHYPAYRRVLFEQFVADHVRLEPETFTEIYERMRAINAATRLVA